MVKLLKKTSCRKTAVPLHKTKNRIKGINTLHYKALMASKHTDYSTVHGSTPDKMQQNHIHCWGLIQPLRQLNTDHSVALATGKWGKYFKKKKKHQKFGLTIYR